MLVALITGKRKERKLIKIYLSEKDFDYELNALVRSFFPVSEVFIEEKKDIDISNFIPGKDKSESEFYTLAQGVTPLASDKDKSESEFYTLAQGVTSLASDKDKSELAELIKKNCKINNQNSGIYIIAMMMEKSLFAMILSYNDGNCVYEDYRAVECEIDGDWHKQADRYKNPNRLIYKNNLKMTIFRLLEALPDEYVYDGEFKRVPVWGTMTGVRPSKIAMDLNDKFDDNIADRLVEVYGCQRQKAELATKVAANEKNILDKSGYENGYSLYAGIPFCPTTCMYCSFASYQYEQHKGMIEAYIKSVSKELKAISDIAGHAYPDKPSPVSIYIGGGTPTALSAEQLDRVLKTIADEFDVSQAVEFTVEAGRPDSITKEKLEVIKSYPVTRISINPQTMNQKTLDIIGRRHTVEQVRDCFNMARNMGFDNINMDLIVGLPGENVSDFKNTLKEIDMLDPDSITVHSLVIKRASRLREVLEESADSDRYALDRSSDMEKMMDEAVNYTDSHGYMPYYMYRQKNAITHFGSSGQENIGFSKKGKESLYNILIMEEKQTIFAAGSAASTKLYLPDEKIVKRVENVKSLTDYIERTDEMINRKRDLFKS